MEKNEEILKRLFEDRKGVNFKHVMVSQGDLLNNGWEGNLPTRMFTKFENYWCHFVPSVKKYKVVKIEPWMLKKSENGGDPNAPLPVSGKPKFNLKDLYKQQIKDKGKPDVGGGV